MCKRYIDQLPLAHPKPGTATQACTPTGNRTNDLLVLRPALNPLSHTNQCINVYSNKLIKAATTHTRIYIVFIRTVYKILKFRLK